MSRLTEHGVSTDRARGVPKYVWIDRSILLLLGKQHREQRAWKFLSANQFQDLHPNHTRFGNSKSHHLLNVAIFEYQVEYQMQDLAVVLHAQIL